MIGQGTYGSVYRAQSTVSAHICAVKEMKLEDGVDRDKLEKELSFCKSLRHPNIVSHLGHDLSDKVIRIFSELADGGSIASWLDEFGRLDDPLLLPASVGILEGLNYLHTLATPVVHGSIKGTNVLVVSAPFRVMLTDFSPSRCEEARAVQSITTCPSPFWLAPEVITSQEGRGPRADVWSCGCTFIEMATAERPWGNVAFGDMWQAMNYIAHTQATPPVPGHVSVAFQEIIRRCTQRAPTERPSTQELLLQLRPLVAPLPRLPPWEVC